jgi:predicted RNA binding protein with dsRBD fold (UPF0201 family)
MNEISVQVEADINPTENDNKVKYAVENLFCDLELEVTLQKRASLLIGKGKGINTLTKLCDLFCRERIRDAARRALYDGLGDKSIIFHLNKQVAFVGHVSFSNPVGESALGPIRVLISCDDPTGLIDWLAPRTNYNERRYNR